MDNSQQRKRQVQKIIKADKDIPIVAKDATFLISLATEEFIKRLCEAGKRVAERERRTTVQHKDIATVVRQADEFLFLEEIIPWVAAEPPAKRKPPAAGSTRREPTMLDQFVVSSKPSEEKEVTEQADIVMNDDGTMEAASSSSSAASTILFPFGAIFSHLSTTWAVMKVVATFHQPSSTLASVKCKLSSRDLEHLVVAKTNRVDVYSLQPHGLKHQCGLEIWGKVFSLKSVPIPGTERSNILLLLGHPEPELILLTYTEDSAGIGELKATKQLSLYDRISEIAEFCTDVVVHPSGKLAVVSCYKKRLRVVTFKSGVYDKNFDVQSPEINLFGIAFLPVHEDEYTLAILHLDYQQRVQLLARDVLLDDHELSSVPSTVLTPTIISPKILPEPTVIVPKVAPVPAELHGSEGDGEDGFGFLGGVLVIGGTKIMLYELASEQSQAKQRSKKRRLESRKKGDDAAEAEKARKKELERERRQRKAQGSVDWPWSEVSAICAVDPLVPRYFIGDEFGRLSMLSLENVKEQGLILLPLGETSPPTTLTYLTNQSLYVGSHLGDPQIVQISPTPRSSLTAPTLSIPPEIKTISPAWLDRASTGKGKAREINNTEDRDPTKGAVVESMGSYVNVLESFKNIAPNHDAVLVDIDGSGERQIVTCSGGAHKGSINVVRNGAHFQELASIPGLTNITNIWGVKNQFEDTYHSHILASTLEASHLFRIDDAGGDTTLTHVQETGLTDKSGLITNLPTLAFGNVTHRVKGPSGKANYLNSQLVVQVTRQGATLLQYDVATGLFQQVAGWTLNGLQVVAASVNPSQVLLALNGGRLVCLGMEDGKTFHPIVKKDSGGLPEISAVSCAPLDPSKPFANYVTVSYWGTNVIEIFVLDPQGFVSVAKSSPLPALVRSVLLYSFGSDHSSKGQDYHPYLLAGLADGSFVYFPWKDKQLHDRKIISLGHAPVSLSACVVDGKRSVFAAGNRATVLSWEKKRLHSSPIMLKEVAAVTSLNTPTFQSSLILATPTGISIGKIQDLDKMHIRSIPLGLDNPLRIAYEPSLKVFGVGISRTEPYRLGDLVESQSSFRLMDDATFTTLANFNCEPGEQVSAVAAHCPVINGTPMPLFYVGVFTPGPDAEPREGRLLAFSASSSDSQSRTSSLQLFLVSEVDVQGCVYSLTFVNDTVVAAVNSAVRSYRLTTSDDVPTPSWSLELLSEWNHNYVVVSLSSYGDRIAVGDQMQSVSLLKVVNGKIQNIARDYGARWAVCVDASDENSIIESNIDLNLSTFTLNTLPNRSLLERNGDYWLADLVTKFIRGSPTSSNVTENAALEPQHVFLCSSGRIGVIIDVRDPQLSLHLSALQRNLAGAIPGVGGGSHTRFRAPKTEKGCSDAEPAPRNFIDGDFVEQFLTYLGSPDQLERIVSGSSEPERLTMPVEEMQKVLENLQSMH
ncbi:putative CPSF A subunit region [Lyophyllum shimeji]|uniref:DNA damage-binding protein 1 n=1 Tax=Lyophyllum shimeji TaxID=47721 RepID=A0A9P3PL41_LYOSH|nr:putative CPSF A subunit region [Lyophyllum shimeji]